MNFTALINSPFVGGLVAGIATLGTGWFAIRVFRLQKQDEKTNSAISILFEIRNAEGKIDVIREKLNSGSTIDLPAVLPMNSWARYSHLFAKDFDSDELKLVNTFYNSCAVIEDLASRQNNFVWTAAKERAETAQRLLGDIHIEFQKEITTGTPLDTAKTKFDAEKRAITEFYTDEAYFYAPKKTLEGLRFEIDRFEKVTTSTCGAKLKQLAGV